MSHSLEIDKKAMYDIRSASQETGYSRDHITTLARAQKIVATQVGRHWYVDLDSLRQYAKITELEQQIKQKHLSEERRLTREISQQVDTARQRQSEARISHHKTAKQAMVTMAAAFVLMLGGVGLFGHDLLTVGNTQMLSAATAPAFLEPVSVKQSGAVQLGDEMVPASTSFTNGAIEVRQLADEEEAIVLLPKNLATSTAVFSDEVEVVTASDGSSRLVPVGQSPEGGVPFVVLPVSEVKTP